MEMDNLILISDFCDGHAVEVSFLTKLQNSGLINIISDKGTLYLDRKELYLIEKIIVFHNELDINIEGVEVVVHLLQKIETMQGEMEYLKNQLNQFKIH